MQETKRLKSMMGKEFQSLGSLLKKKWRDKFDGDLGCCNLRAIRGPCGATTEYI